MQLTFDKIKRRLTIQSEAPDEAAYLKATAEDMKKHDAAINVTYPLGNTRIVMTPATARFVLAANQFYQEQTAR